MTQMTLKKPKRVWVPFKELEKNQKILRSCILAFEFAISLMGIVCLILTVTKFTSKSGVGVDGSVGPYFPMHRLLPCMGAIAVGLFPITFERIIKHRFTASIHIIAMLQLLGSVLGAVFMFHEFVWNYDKIMHFLLGYVSCMLILAVYIDSVENFGPIKAVIIYVMFSMGVAAVWECVFEFGVDMFMGQTSLGIPTAELLAKVEELGLTGYARGKYILEHIGVWDTVTDMFMHLCGSLVFTAQYLIHRMTGKNAFIGFYKREIIENKMNKSVLAMEPPETPAEESQEEALI